MRIVLIFFLLIFMTLNLYALDQIKKVADNDVMVTPSIVFIDTNGNQTEVYDSNNATHYGQNKIDEENLKKQERLSTGPFYMGTEPTQEFAIGGRVNLAEGSEDDLYIPPLETPQIKRDGVEGLYFDLKNEPREKPPITSGGIKELKQVFSSMLSDTKPEIGYGIDRLNLSATKGINPFQGDRDIRYQATYNPEGDSGKFMIAKTPQALGAGYSYQNDGLDLGITGLRNQMGDKSIMLRFGYKYNNGGRVGFQLGGSSNFYKMIRTIDTNISQLRNHLFHSSTSELYSGKDEAIRWTTKNWIGQNKSPKDDIFQYIKDLKRDLPKEYHSTLDDIKNLTEKTEYVKAKQTIDALDDAIDPNLRFKNLSKDLFPMLDPLNDAFIIHDPTSGVMQGRYVLGTTVNTKTGRGIRVTYDRWDPETNTVIQDKEQWKLKGSESIEKGKEGLN